MILATVFFALMQLTVKYLNRIPAIELVFFRCLVSFVLSAGMLAYERVPLLGKPKNRWLLLGRGAIGAIALSLFFITLQKLPLASAVLIQFLSPIFATVLGMFLVGEKVKPWQYMFFALSFSGVLVIRGFNTDLSWLYVGFGLASAMLAGVAYNIIRKLKNAEHPLVIIFYFPLVTMPVTGIWVAFNWVQPVGYEWLLLLACGVFTQIAQYFMTVAYQSDEISKVASLKYMGIIYALLLGYFLFDEAITWSLIGGMALVILGIVLNLAYKRRLEKQANN